MANMKVFQLFKQAEVEVMFNVNFKRVLVGFIAANSIPKLDIAGNSKLAILLSCLCLRVVQNVLDIHFLHGLSKFLIAICFFDIRVTISQHIVCCFIAGSL